MFSIRYLGNLEWFESSKRELAAPTHTYLPFPSSFRLPACPALLFRPRLQRIHLQTTETTEAYLKDSRFSVKVCADAESLLSLKNVYAQQQVLCTVSCAISLVPNRPDIIPVVDWAIEIKYRGPIYLTFGGNKHLNWTSKVQTNNQRNKQGNVDFKSL